jgi:hypothetical protein
MQIKIHTYINMVKNIPTIERSTKIRFGKHVSDSQAENTIVFNASDTAITATNSGSMYMAPLRVAEIAGSNLVGYSASTKEIVDSSIPTTLLGGVTLQSATENGNTTDKFIGFQNTAPTHAISVADKVFIHNTNSIDQITVVGNVNASKYKTTTDAVLIQDSGTDKIQVSGRIHSSELTTSKIGIANTAPAHAISIGNQGQVQMNVPTESIYALDTVGNVNALNYRGDSYYLSNLTMENIVNQGNSTSNTVRFSNALTGIYTLSNVDVGGHIFVRNSSSAIYGKIEGANTISASTITTSTPIANTYGGTGHSAYAPGTLLYGSSDHALTKLEPASGTEDVNKYLKLGDNDIPAWAENVAAKISAEDSSANSESPVPFMSAATGSAAIYSDADALKYNASTGTLSSTNFSGIFTGDGSGISSLNESNLSSAVSVTKGGTGLNTVTAGDILYANANDTVAGLDKGAGNAVLQMKSDGTLPEWTQTISNVSLASPSLTGTVTTQLDNNRIPFTNGSGELSSHSDLQFTSSSGNSTMTIGADVTITGAFKTQGTVDHLETTNYTVTDPIIEVGNNNSTDSIDLGMIMTMGTANVVHGFRGNQKEYTIAYTHSNPSDTSFNPTLASGITDHPYITANIWGNVLSGNVTTTGMVDAATLKGNGANITHLNLGDTNNNTGKVSVVRGGTDIDTYTAGDILYASGSAGQSSTTLTKLAANDGKFLKSTSSAVVWADVSSTLDAVASNGPAGANTTSNTIQFTNTVNSLTASGNVIVSGNVISTGVITLESSASSRQALKVLNAIEVDPSYATSSHNVLSINRTTGEIFDSGGQGGSTMEFTHEEGTGIHANVSIGKNAWAGPTGESNLTMNTYGSNVLTVTGNVSATNITIGGLHVAASPFDLDDVCSGSAGANVITSNVIQFTGPHASYGENNFTTSKSISIGSNVNADGHILVGVDATITGNVTSQNLQLTNTKITATYDQSTTKITIDALNKSYGAAELVTVTADIDKLAISNLPVGGQVVIPLLASGTDVKVLKSTTEGIDYIAFTDDVSISSGSHGLMTVSKLGIASGKIYMNAIAFTAA